MKPPENSGHVEIREEGRDDWPAVQHLNREAFGGPDEAELIGRLRHEGLVAASLVAKSEGTVVGHILLSWLPTEVDGRAVRALALAPMAVKPGRQRRGIGTRLVEASIAEARKLGAEAIIVVGHPGYYPRFGFSAAVAAKLASPFSGEAFMALELVQGALSGTAGVVTYPAAFRIDSSG